MSINIEIAAPLVETIGKQILNPIYGVIQVIKGILTHFSGFRTNTIQIRKLTVGGASSRPHGLWVWPQRGRATYRLFEWYWV